MRSAKKSTTLKNIAAEVISIELKVDIGLSVWYRDLQSVL